MPAIQRPELLPLPAELRGERVLLRPYREGDGAAFFEAIDQHRAELRTWLAWVDRYASPADTEAYVRRMAGKWLTRESLVMGIWTHDGNYCGGAGFHGFDWAVPSMELGYFLHPGAWGRGLGTEAVRLLSDWAISDCGAARLWAGCDVNNARSWRLLERCGFLREARLRRYARDHHGQLRDDYLYARISESAIE